jgi:uridine kinase
LFVAIVGGSGAGKSWLATKLHRALRPLSARLSLDDFYRDRSRLPPARRARLNFDHPRAIDWPRWEQALRVCAAGKIGRIPRYDFATHTRRVQEELFRPKPIVLVDGLWLLRRRSLRSLFAVRIYIDCPKKLRLRRRLGRDQQARRRTREAILRQFRQTVDPMHALYVAPQVGWATIRLQGKWGEKEVRQIAKEIREMRAAR